MDDIEIKIIEKPKLKNSILVEGLPGIGLVGKLAVQHMLDELKAKKFLELYSSYLPPQVFVQKEGTIKLVNMELYYWKNKKNDLILLIGDFQGITPRSQYLLSDKIIEICKEFDLKKIFTLGGLGTGNMVKTPRVFGAATNKKLVEDLKKYDVVFRGGGAIFGAAGLLIGLGMQKGYDGICLMGETHGQIIDAKAAEAVLNVLTKILDIKIDMTKLANKAKETEEQIDKLQRMITEEEAVEKIQEKFMRETPTYIR